MTHDDKCLKKYTNFGYFFFLSTEHKNGGCIRFCLMDSSELGI
jgi:hypothetical protein